MQKGPTFLQLQRLRMHKTLEGAHLKFMGASKHAQKMKTVFRMQISELTVVMTHSRWLIIPCKTSGWTNNTLPGNDFRFSDDLTRRLSYALLSCTNRGHIMPIELKIENNFSGAIVSPCLGQSHQRHGRSQSQCLTFLCSKLVLLISSL